MVDSRQKGARAEAAAKGVLIKHTGLDWQRTPGSGALNAAHKLKGDLYIPDCKNAFCVEVKHYKDDHFTSKILTDKNPKILEWWAQAVRQGGQTGREPLLLFKFDRSKWFVGFPYAMVLSEEYTLQDYKYVEYHFENYDGGKTRTPIVVSKLTDWLEHEEIKWIL